MKRIRPLLLVAFHSAVLSGGNRRTYEILRLAKSEGIDYIVMTDVRSCENAAKMFPAYLGYAFELQGVPEGPWRKALANSAPQIISNLNHSTPSCVFSGG